MRQGLEGERRRLSERNSMLTRELREREAAARVETDRLAQEVRHVDPNPWIGMGKLCVAREGQLGSGDKVYAPLSHFGRFDCVEWEVRAL